MYKAIQCASGQYGLAGNVETVQDILLSSSEMEYFVALLNKFGVSEIHIYDVIEDYFGSYKFLHGV